MTHSAEHQRLLDHREFRANWRNWGPYLSERAWGTVREDYSAGGNAWRYFPHDHARSRAYRWNEDGLMGISDRNGSMCFALALWNGQDHILKERLFGLTGPQGNHGEDVKEQYFYLDNTPTHSYMKMLYKYPQAAFPYAKLVEENQRRGYGDDEYELLDTGIFDGDRYFDVFIEYAKAGENDILVQITAVNRGPEAALLHILPTLWFRNTWSWGYENGPLGDTPTRPCLEAISASNRGPDGVATIRSEHPDSGPYLLHAEALGGDPPELLFTENETNRRRLFGVDDGDSYTKDAFHRYLIDGEQNAVKPQREGTKGAFVYSATLAAGETLTVRLRLSSAGEKISQTTGAAERTSTQPFADFDDLLQQRRDEADEFYRIIQRGFEGELHADARRIQRQAFAGLLWSKQLYYYDVEQWLDGDPAQPQPPRARKNGRNSEWQHLHNLDAISMPDKWEYPWYATWDSAFHMLPFALIDPDYAKRQLELFTREWYMHPNGQLPAYEWNFSDVNPPVHAWAAWRVYKIEQKHWGRADRDWLEGIFHKLLLNFTWWVNRKDEEGRNVFQGGFLGMDNVSVFDRSEEMPAGARLDQADGTAWMGAYCLTMLTIALELARENKVYEDTATKFFEHFLRIASAMSERRRDGHDLWDEKDGFFYDHLYLGQRESDGPHQNHDDHYIPIEVRSMVGLLPLIAVDTIEPDVLETLPTFARRINWFISNRPHLAGNMASVEEPGVGERRLLAILTEEKLRSVLKYLLDEDEFLSPHGIRSVSKFHEREPYSLDVDGDTLTLKYWPAESRSPLFGGNSNWRGPIWFPTNYLIIEALQRFHHYYGDEFKVECPTGSGNEVTLWEVACELSERLMGIFTADEKGRRPVHGSVNQFRDDPHWRDYILFYEYFHGNNGAGLGASHQTGWTALVAKLLQQSGERL